MVHFFRDILDGPIYLVFVIICILLIMAIIGFIMERKKWEKEEREKITVVGGVNSLEPVKAREVILSSKTETQPKTVVANSITNPEIDLKRDSVFTLDSNQVKVAEKEVESKEESPKVIDVIPTIDFTSAETHLTEKTK